MPTSRPPFVVGVFLPDADGTLRPQLPRTCPWATSTSCACVITVDHHRKRKSGPPHPLPVLHCRRHPKHRFTFYPLGWVPYARVPVVQVATTGQLLDGGHDMAGALLGPATDAAAGRLWPEGSPPGDARRRRTQGRHIELAAQLLGVHPAQPDPVRELVAARLDIDTLLVREAAASWGAGWVSRGQAVCRVTARLRWDDGLLERLLHAGGTAGLWPPPLVGRPSPRIRRARAPTDLSQGALHEQATS